MNKAQFLRTLAERLRGLPEIDIARSLDYWEEMIDDRIEDGMTEEEAVAALGDPEAAAREILAGARMQPDTPEPRKKTSFLAGFLIALASPLLLVYWVLILTVILVLWCFPIAFWAVFAGSAAASAACLFGSAVKFAAGNLSQGILFAGGCLFASGLSILFFFASAAVTKAAAKLTVRLVKVCAAPFGKGR